MFSAIFTGESCGWCILVDEASPLTSLATRERGKGQGGRAVHSITHKAHTHGGCVKCVIMLSILYT